MKQVTNDSNDSPTSGTRVFRGQYSSVKPKNLGKDAKFRVSTGLKLVPKILN
ncbi:hypothetical protein GXM_03716 [Nostoc sphaeroides CCNUC1]|uniref:Uncharacterized protein n=1 Tax=Nostoc sphaeroides CCNUC1 TaxID=2653204 RepID=A0A5P8W1V8_9NOSO|nr:hypothetical protein GXM_03716 [Nostoc sphaeroides CCNUC1]